MRAITSGILLPVSCLGLLAAILSPAPSRAVQEPASTGSDPVWVSLHGAIPARTRASAAYDPVRRQLVVAHGQQGSTLCDDWWTLRLDATPRWQNVSPLTLGYSAFASRAMVFDPLRDRFVMLGGQSSVPFAPQVNAVSLDGAFVYSYLTSGPTRDGLTALYDPLRDRIVIFGGADVSNGSYPRVVEVLTLGASPALSTLSTAGVPPPGRKWHAAIYDPANDRMLIFGGRDSLAARLADLWQLTLSGTPTWTQLPTDPNGPSARFGAGAIFDPAHQRMLLVGGDDGAARNDVWQLSLSASPAWSELSPAGPIPPARGGLNLVHDSVHQRALLFGGADGATQFQDVWALALTPSTDWSRLDTGVHPSPRTGHGMALDPGGDRAILFGGHGGSHSFQSAASVLGDLWYLDLAGGNWHPLAASGTPPAARRDHVMVRDPVRNRMLVIGGRTASAALNDVWELGLGASPTWQALSPSGTPPVACTGHSAIYDPVRDRVIVFGGEAGIGNDTWALTFTPNLRWTKLSPAGPAPSTRRGHLAVYDATGDRMIVFGGNVGGFPIYMANDAWALSLGPSPAWSQFAPAGLAPSEREGSAGYFDPARGQLRLFGGLYGRYGGLRGVYVNKNDVRALSLDAAPMWSIVTVAGWPALPRSGMPGVYDSARDRFIFTGGLYQHESDVTQSTLFSDSWAIYFTPATTSVGPAQTEQSIAISRISPNPAAGPVVIEFRLPEAQPVALELLDLAGRRIAGRALGTLPAGGHRIRFDETVRLRTGIYFAVLSGRTGRSSARLCLMR